jgi:hypothetical protein
MPVHAHRPQVLLLAGLAFCVCAWSQTEKKPEPVGQIYVYANWESPERKWVDIACDDEIVAKVKAGRFFVMSLPPGRHAVSAGDGIPVFVEERSGEKSFLRVGREVDGQAVMLVLTKMDSTEAGKEMVHLAYIDAAKALSSSVPKEDPRDLRQQPQLKTRGDRE